MDGCIGGRWVMGVPYTQNASITLPPTTTYGVYESKLYETIQPVKVEIDAMVTTAAEVRASRARLFPSYRRAVIASNGRSAWRWCGATTRPHRRPSTATSERAGATPSSRRE